MDPDDASATAQEGQGVPPEKAGTRESAPRSRAPLTPDGMERPAFLLDFPEDPALDRLIEAFESGNFARVREDAEKLATSTENTRVKDAALELRRRIDPDPLAKYLLAISLLLLIVLSVWAYRVQTH
jgi:hypothetical protein